ncbi:hypothetical protein N9166_00090 [bacterium]|nr:hypothetical protein [bacterium]MDB4433120.1 hypothetical protein [bacterium]
MAHERGRAEQLAITNPKKGWVVSELDKLIKEWESWQDDVAAITDRPYDRNTQSEVYADGQENLDRHQILQEKTRTFLDNNIEGHGFITGRDGTHIDRTDLRLPHRVRHRLQELRVLQASLDYAKVPESYWRAKAKQVVDTVAEKSPEAAVELLTRVLKNPDLLA